MSKLETEWSDISGKLGNMKAYIRRRNSLEKIKHSNYPYLTIITLVFDALDNNGIPSDSDEIDRAVESEKRIAEVLEKQNDSYFVLSVTHNGVVDLFFFSANNLETDAVEELIYLAKPTINFDFTVLEDPKWEAYFNTRQ